MAKIIRRKSRVIKIGGINIGGDNLIAIQSMTKTKTSDAQATAKQIRELERAGCQIVRLALKDRLDARAVRQIKQASGLPLVADIHFDWRLALEAIDNGIDKIRLNPGNIYKKEQIREIASAARLNCIPIRVGLNSGSVKRNAQNTRRNTIADAMVRSALSYIRTLESFRFYDIVVSLKASGILDTIEAYQKMAKLCDYPFHLGLTATGLPKAGAIKSSVAIGGLLLAGIGDTIRVSLTDKPQEEVRVAKYILEALGLRSFGPEVISCPTCGRCEVDLISLVKKFEGKLVTMNHQLSTMNSQPIKVALMGCVVNGPGEAKGADVGVAFGKKRGLLFKDGAVVKKISPAECIDTLLKEAGKRYDKVNKRRN